MLEEGQNLVQITLSERDLADVECIATGIYSPLEGFVTEEDYNSIVDNMRLANGTVFPIPVTLQVDTGHVS
ncbi:MAG: sulfate adenylyltransferase, partial [Candidatus Kariarchaeaceae archaeon]